MVLRTAARGTYAGQQFWGCSTYPKCRAVVGITSVGADADLQASHRDKAGASAQAEFSRRKAQHRRKIRAAWPLLIGVWIVLAVAFAIGFAMMAQPFVGGLLVVGSGVLFLYLALEVPQITEAWRIGAEGEQKTAAHLAGLGDDFVVLNDRRGPGYGGNLDHIAVGPSGVWVIETKSYRGAVAVHGDRLEINDQPRDKIVEQVYREAVAVQIAMGDRLSNLGLTVTPVLCLHRAKLGWLAKTIRGVRLVDGRGLVKLLRSDDRRLSDDQVQSLATELDRLFGPATP